MQLDLFNLIDTQGKASSHQKSAAKSTGAEDLHEEFNQVLGLAIGGQMRPDGMGMDSAAEGGSGEPGQGPSGQGRPTLQGWNLTSPVVVADDQPAAPVAGEARPSMPLSQQAFLREGVLPTAEPLIVVGTEQPASAGGTGTTLDLQASGTAMLEVAPRHGRPLPDRMPPPSLAPSAEALPNALDGRPVVGESPQPGWQATAPYNPGGRPVVAAPPPATWQAEAPPAPDGRPVPEGVRPPTIIPGEAVPPGARPVPEPATLPAPDSRKLQALEGRPVVHPPSTAASQPDQTEPPAEPDQPPPPPGPGTDRHPEFMASPAATTGASPTAGPVPTAPSQAHAAGSSATATGPITATDPASGAGVARTPGSAMSSSISGSDEVRSVPRQVSRFLLTQPLGGRGEQRLTMQLDPEHLGRVEVRMVSTGDRLEVVIQAESTAAGQVLRENVQDLIRALSSRIDGRWQHVDVRVQEAPAADRTNRDPGGRQPDQEQGQSEDQQRNRDQQSSHDPQGQRPEAGRPYQPQA